MTYGAGLAEAAERDLRDACERMSYDLGSPGAAARFVRDVRKATASLSTFPKRRPPAGFEPWRTRGTRRVPVGRYLAFFVTDDREAVAGVIRIVYGGRDASAALGRMAGKSLGQGLPAAARAWQARPRVDAARASLGPWALATPRPAPSGRRRDGRSFAGMKPLHARPSA